MKALDHPRSTCTSIFIVNTNRNLIKRPPRIPYTPHLTVIPEMKTIPRTWRQHHRDRTGLIAIYPPPLPLSPEASFRPNPLSSLIYKEMNGRDKMDVEFDKKIGSFGYCFYLCSSCFPLSPPFPLPQLLSEFYPSSIPPHSFRFHGTYVWRIPRTFRIVWWFRKHHFHVYLRYILSIILSWIIVLLKIHKSTLDFCFPISLHLAFYLHRSSLSLYPIH